MKEKILKSVIVVLVISTIITGYYAFRLKEQYSNLNNNNYTEAFSNLVNYMNNIENYLAKAMISRGSEQATKTLTEIWKNSDLAIVYLSRIPLDEEGLSQTSKFLNQVSDYSYSLSRKSIGGEELKQEDFDNLKNLYQYSLDLEQTLNQLSEEIYNGTIDWKDLNMNSNTKFAQAVDSINVFSNIDDNLNEYEGLIYDGAYSDHINKMEKLGLTGNDISEEDAKNKAKDFFNDSEYSVKNIENNGFIENADIPMYDFTVEFDNVEEKCSISISKKGGHVVETSFDRSVNEEKISQQEANEIGKKYLSDKGFKDMKETYFVKQGNIVTINYAYNDNGIIVYPDLIKVKVALDNGQILGIETNGYLNSHTDRTHKSPKITMEEAKSKLNPDLEIMSEGKAIIPTEWKSEILCYEFKGKVDGKEFLVYINVETGKEEDILVILDTPGGTLTV